MGLSFLLLIWVAISTDLSDFKLVYSFFALNTKMMHILKIMQASHAY